jgi:hypothetical protein
MELKREGGEDWGTECEDWDITGGWAVLGCGENGVGNCCLSKRVHPYHKETI